MTQINVCDCAYANNLRTQLNLATAEIACLVRQIELMRRADDLADYIRQDEAMRRFVLEEEPPAPPRRRKAESKS